MTMLQSCKFNLIKLVLEFLETYSTEVMEIWKLQSICSICMAMFGTPYILLLAKIS